MWRGVLLPVPLPVLLLLVAGWPAAADERLFFAPLDGGHTVSGSLSLPAAAGKVPAVVVVHGTGGIDSRGAYYIGPLNRAGIATFEVDFKTGVFNSARDRPPNDTFLPMAFAALKLLRDNPAIDGERIGIMGFSLGGHLTLGTLLTANRQHWLGAAKGFAAHAAFYPSCRYFLAKPGLDAIEPAPLMVFYGLKDSYGDGQACPALRERLSRTMTPPPTFIAYPEAGHGFDRTGPPVTAYDPAADGHQAVLEWNGDAAEDARARVVAFFTATLAQ